jgi:hypothetical protein
MLRNRNYLGDLNWNKSSRGEFQEIQDGNIVKRKSKGYRRRQEPEMIICPGSHPALIDRATFEKVQARLDGNRERKTPQRAGGDWLLSGLMVCGHCGSLLVGKSSWHRNIKRRRRVYICNAYQRWGKSGCQCHYVYEAQILDVLVRKLQEDFLNPNNLVKLREELHRQAAQTTKQEGAEEAQLRRQIEALDRDIAEGNKNMARAQSVDAIEGIAAAIREWRGERDRLALRLAGMGRTDGRGTTEAEIEEAEKQLWALRDGLEQEDPAQVRAVLREMVDRVELWWEHEQVGPYLKARFSRGLIYLKPDERLFHTCQRNQCNGTGTIASA